MNASYKGTYKKGVSPNTSCWVLLGVSSPCWVLLACARSVYSTLDDLGYHAPTHDQLPGAKIGQCVTRWTLHGMKPIEVFM